MSYDIHYTIRENKKSSYWIQTLFWGKQKTYDYKKYIDKIFYTYNDALEFFNNNDLDYKKYHIRKTVSTSGYVRFTDYIHRRN